MAFQLETSLLIWGSFLKRLAFGSRLLVSFLSREKIWLKSIFEKWAIFGQCALRHQSRWFQTVMILELVFWSLKRFGRFEAVASLDAYQITNYQFPSKTHHFYCLIFAEFEKFLKQEFYGRLPEQAWSKDSFDLSKIMPLGAPRSLIQMVPKMKGSVYRGGFITNNNHQFFQDPKSNIWTTFSFFALTLWSWNLFLFRTISNICNDKRRPKQVYSFHANVDIKVKFAFLKKNTFTN